MREHKSKFDAHKGSPQADRFGWTCRRGNGTYKKGGGEQSIEEFEESIAETFLSAIDSEEMSKSDLESIGEEATEVHVRQVVQLLNYYWDDIELDANNMIEQAARSRPEDGKVFRPATGKQSMAEFFGIKTTEAEAEDINSFLGISNKD